jgi:hypothetical protein
MMQDFRAPQELDGALDEFKTYPRGPGWNRPGSVGRTGLRNRKRRRGSPKDKDYHPGAPTGPSSVQGIG